MNAAMGDGTDGIDVEERACLEEAKTMNLLTLAISPCEEYSSGDIVFFLVEASVDGVTLPEWLDVDELFRSLAPLEKPILAKVTKTKPKPKKARAVASAATKRLPIFNCSCGAFGCGGYYVEVTRTREALIWEGPFVHSSRAAGMPRLRYAFSWENVRQVAGELIAAIVDAVRQYPESEVGSGIASANLAECLPFYRERYAALERVGVV